MCSSILVTKRFNSNTFFRYDKRLGRTNTFEEVVIHDSFNIYSKKKESILFKCFVNELFVVRNRLNQFIQAPLEERVVAWPGLIKRSATTAASSSSSTTGRLNAGRDRANSSDWPRDPGVTHGARRLFVCFSSGRAAGNRPSASYTCSRRSFSHRAGCNYYARLSDPITDPSANASPTDDLSLSLSLTLAVGQRRAWGVLPGACVRREVLFSH